MSLVVPDAGELPMLNAIVSALTLRLRLFTNNITPNQASVIGDFTEATFNGSAAQTPTLGAATTVSHKATVVDSATRTFTKTAGGASETVYGYYLTDASATICYWAERFPAPISIASTGDAISILLQLTLNSEF